MTAKEESITIQEESLEESIPELWMLCRVPLDNSTTTEYPNPKRLYKSQAQALHDAEQMCTQSGRKFYILRVVGMVEQTAPPVKWSFLGN